MSFWRSDESPLRSLVVPLRELLSFLDDDPSVVFPVVSRFSNSISSPILSPPTLPLSGGVLLDDFDRPWLCRDLFLVSSLVDIKEVSSGTRIPGLSFRLALLNALLEDEDDFEGEFLSPSLPRDFDRVLLLEPLFFPSGDFKESGRSLDVPRKPKLSWTSGLAKGFSSTSSHKSTSAKGCPNTS